MKTIGLLGGMSWESTVTYYRIINETIMKELGGFHSSKCIIYSVDFDEIEACQSSGNWEKSGEILGDAAKKLQDAGADLVIICANTMHKVVKQIKEKISIPLIHIADATCDEIEKTGMKKVALLGTKYTMEQDFYKQILIDRGLTILIPNEEERVYINNVLYTETGMGIIKEESKKRFLEIIDRLVSQGAECAILGCTEIGLLINQNDTKTPLFDTTIIHATRAALYSIDK
ncbi:putative racemase YgeA [bioreactor metagenome]|uniref:Putative racemase YgeA n=1 Tax=bioreactor metagenome TaxID=1076179 RepID=A0A645FP09_9ZZZZ